MPENAKCNIRIASKTTGMGRQIPHPLAVELIERIGTRYGMRVLELGSGRGRNTAALREAGLDVDAVADEQLLPAPALGDNEFDAALSTHGFLHGTPEGIAGLLSSTARALKDGSPMFATFASTRDARFGEGVRIAENTYAPSSGDEEGVPHVYYDEPALREMLERDFAIEALEEIDADAIVGRWAHSQRPEGTVHWFARVRKRD